MSEGEADESRVNQRPVSLGINKRTFYISGRSRGTDILGGRGGGLTLSLAKIQTSWVFRLSKITSTTTLYRRRQLLVAFTLRLLSVYSILSLIFSCWFYVAHAWHGESPKVDQSIVLVFQPSRLSVKPEKLWVKVRYNSIRHLNVISELALLRNEGGE